MSQFRKKPVLVEAITFDELVAHGIRCLKPEYLHNGIPWSFAYEGHAITHENDDCYLIPTLEGTMRFNRGDRLITGVKGEIYPCKLDIFLATYEQPAVAEGFPCASCRGRGSLRYGSAEHGYPETFTCESCEGSGREIAPRVSERVGGGSQESQP